MIIMKNSLAVLIAFYYNYREVSKTANKGLNFACIRF